MASERAKKLAAEQKAAMKAEKLRRKNSDDPKDWGRVKQFIEAFRQTAKYDKLFLPLLIGTIVLVIAAGIVLSFFFEPGWTVILFAILLSLTAGMGVLNWRAKGAMFTRFAGQPGAAEVAMNLLPKKWVKDPVIAFDRYQNIVHRVVGPAGIVLIGEGQPGRAREMLKQETKRHEAIKYAVPVTSILMGDAANQVPLTKLDKHIKRLPKAIAPRQVTEIMARLKVLDSSRPKMPIPKGPLPTMKGARAALRGR